MLKSVTLQNFRSFGVVQTVPLQPISVLVGPNNSGKSNFLSVGQLVRDAMAATRNDLVKVDPGLFHRPPTGDGTLLLAWEVDEGTYSTSVGDGRATMELIRLANGAEFDLRLLAAAAFPLNPAFAGLQTMVWAPTNVPAQAHAVVRPLARSRDVKLSLKALRADALGAGAPLGADGSNLAGVVNRWRSSDPDRNDQLEAVVRQYVPEVRRVLAPARQSGTQTTFRLEFEQVDGQRFDAQHVSDGLLFFTGLAAHVIDAGEEALILMEEPENSIHPRRLHDVAELLRRMGEERRCQFVLATHSPVLLDEFRDDPDAILLFRRGPDGTVVKPLSQVERLNEALAKTRPGEMLAHGFFSDGF